MKCSTYFDMAVSGFQNWGVVLSGIALALAGLFLFFLIDGRSTRSFLYKWAALVSFIVLLLSVASAIRGYVHYRELTSSATSPEIAIGVVKDLHQAGQLGKQIESFFIDDKKFSYSGTSFEPGFHQTFAQGSPLRNGMLIRVHYVGDTIVKLELCGPMPAPGP